MLALLEVLVLEAELVDGYLSVVSVLVVGIEYLELYLLLALVNCQQVSRQAAD